ncbi:hypothetical protein [Streptomyces misionensis]
MENENARKTKSLAPSGPSVWRTTRCDDCGDEIEVNQYGDRTLCTCSVSC